jgi:hypothetical protein
MEQTPGNISYQNDEDNEDNEEPLIDPDGQPYLAQV